MAERIAILTSTRFLCKEIPRHGRTPRRAIDPRACVALAEKFDLVIIASGATDKVYEHISQALPVQIGHKFRLHSRSDLARRAHSAPELDDQALALAWMQILKENGIFFLTEREVVNEDYSTSTEKFDSRNMKDFIVDDRVTLVTERRHFMPAP